KRGEEPIGVGHVKACPVVSYEESGLFLRECSDENGWVLAVGRELPSVSEQVHENYSYESTIPTRPHPLGYFDTDGSMRVSLPKVGDYLACKEGEVHVLFTQWRASDARKLKQSVDEVSHALHALLGALDVATASVIENVLKIFSKCACKPTDRAERCPQVM